LTLLGAERSQRGNQMSNACMGCQSNECQGKPIFAQSNTAGAALQLCVKGMALATIPQNTAAVFDYDKSGDLIEVAIAEAYNIPSEFVVSCGSTMVELERLPQILGCSSVICLEGDFVGYSRHKLLGGRVLYVPCKSGPNGLDIESLRRVCSSESKPLVVFSAVTSNPMQAVLDPDFLVQVILSANPKATILIDSAYADFCKGSGQAQIARLVTVTFPKQVLAIAPASKILFIPGARVGWQVSGDPDILALLRAARFPYPLSAGASAPVVQLLNAPGVLHAARSVIGSATSILRDGLKCLFPQIQVISGVGPWVVIELAPEEASALSAELSAQEIYVQQQQPSPTGLGVGFLRISATVPCEATRIIDAISRWVDGRKLVTAKNSGS
jgi:histidinol-phosphate/aromatic aminotransferase/cobyric acid decarboxylase-like protein